MNYSYLTFVIIIMVYILDTLQSLSRISHKYLSQLIWALNSSKTLIDWMLFFSTPMVAHALALGLSSHLLPHQSHKKSAPFKPSLPPTHPLISLYSSTSPSTFAILHHICPSLAFHSLSCLSLPKNLVLGLRCLMLPTQYFSIMVRLWSLMPSIASTSSSHCF